MEDVDIDLFDNHDKPEETGKAILFNQGGVVVGGGSTWESEHKQETSFRGRQTKRTRLKEAQVEGLHRKLTEITHQTPEALHFDD